MYWLRQEHRAESDFFFFFLSELTTSFHYKLTPILSHQDEKQGIGRLCSHKLRQPEHHSDTVNDMPGVLKTECVFLFDVKTCQPFPAISTSRTRSPGGGRQAKFKPGVYCMAGASYTLISMTMA